MANTAPPSNQNDYNVTVAQLRGVMEFKNEEALAEIDKQFGSLGELVTRLKSHLQSGINEEDVAKRQKIFGKNEIPPKPPKSIFRLAFEALQDPTLMLLIACAVISIGLSFYHAPADEQDEDVRLPASSQSNLEWVEGVAIAIAVCVVVGVSSFNDWRKERQFRGLQDRIAKDNNATLVRGDKLVQVNVKDIVVGDICCIKYGDLVPADGIVTDASDLKIDESSLTGETDLIKKNTTKNVTILSGTHVMEGSGRFLVTAVGLNSQTGIIMRLLGAANEEKDDDDDDKEEKKKKKSEEKEKKTNKVTQNPGPNVENGQQTAPSTSRPGTADAGARPGSAGKSKKVELKPPKKQKKHKSVLQTKLAKLSMIIGYIGMTAAVLTFLILLFRLLIEELAIKKKSWSNSNIKYILSYFIQGITVIVVAVPEGLPLAVTLALAFAVQKMTKDNNLVRHIDACETMGNATAICSDKTGTLTTNRMTAVQCWIGGTLHEKIPSKTQVNEKILNLIYQSISVNSNYSSLIEAPKQANELPKQLGNKTECGLLGLVLDLGGSYEEVRQKYPLEQLAKVYTFNSARKMMSTAIKNENGGYRLHSKGASEMVLSKCGYYLDHEGNPVKMNAEKIDEIIKNVVEKMASNGLRTICVAYRDFNGGSEPGWDTDEASIIADLTCICLVGIEDPVRPEVPDAIKKCQSSGVVVRMVTGDNINTATSIAMKCGIVKPGDDFLILESKDFNQRIKDENGEVKQELLDQVWPKLRVLARSSPQDKYILVNGIVESTINPDREVVAVTGDGTNDGPALKRADVGFAMGIQGTDVAKEASDIILTDDNFSSIVKAMMWGRNVYDSIAKFLQFQLTVNFIAGIFALFCSALIQSVPLKAVQMLWVNLVMDTLASLALATEPPTEALLQRKPYGRTKPIVSMQMMKMIVLQGLFQLAVLFVLIYEIEDWMAVENIVNYNSPAKLQEPSVHFTIIFNVFVIMTLFNEVNCRMIDGTRNVFSGIWNNWIFIVIWVVCFGGQILIVNVGGVVMSVQPIPWDAWMWSLFLGGSVMLWHQFILTIPTWPFEKLADALTCCGKKEPKDEPKKDEKIEMKEKISREFSSKEYWMSSVHKIQLQLQVARQLAGFEKQIS